MMIIIPIIIGIAIAAAAGALLYQSPQAAAISGVECNRNEFNNYHVHSHLDVFVNGGERQVPDNVGILTSPSCLYWLHTHSSDGIIHVEAPQARQFTLGQFLDIWEQTRDQQGLFDSVSGMNVTAYVNGEQFEGNYRDVQLESQKQVVLAYGQPPAEIPEYDFGGLR